MSDVDFQNENISQSLEAFAENLQSLFQSFQIQAENDLSKKQSKAIEEQAIYMQKALRMMGSRLDNQDRPAVIKTEYQAVGNGHRKNDSLHLDGRKRGATLSIYSSITEPKYFYLAYGCYVSIWCGCFHGAALVFKSR